MCHIYFVRLESGSGVAPRRRRRRRRRRRGWGTRCRDHRTTRSRSAGRHAPRQSRFLPTFARCLTECSSKQTSMPLQSWQHIGQSPPCPVGPSWQCTAKADLDGRDDGRVEQQHPARHEHPCRDACAIGGHTRPAFRNDSQLIGPRSKRDRNILLIRARAPCMKRDCGWMSLPSARTQASGSRGTARIAGSHACRPGGIAVNHCQTRLRAVGPHAAAFRTARPSPSPDARACADAAWPGQAGPRGRVPNTPRQLLHSLPRSRRIQAEAGAGSPAALKLGSKAGLRESATQDPVDRRSDKTRTARAARAHPGRDHHQGAGRAGARERAGHRLPCLPTRPFGGPMPKMHSSQVSRSCSMPRRCLFRSWSIASLSRSCAGPGAGPVSLGSRQPRFGACRGCACPSPP